MIVRTLMAASILLGTTGFAFANSVEGTVLAFDRKAALLVLNDKTVWTLEGAEAAVPSDLKAGDKIKIDFETAGEEGITKIDAIERLSD